MRKQLLWLGILLLALIAITGCEKPREDILFVGGEKTPTPILLTPEPLGTAPVNEVVDSAATPLPTRERWSYNSPLPYTVTSGDTLAVLAIRFEVTPEEILAANPFLDPNFTTLPPGMPLTIPARYFPIDGSPFKIIPDSELVYGVGQLTFDTQQAILGFGGAMATYLDTERSVTLTSWEDLDAAALEWGINPRLLMALIEYRSGTVTGQGYTEESILRPLGVSIDYRVGLTRQIVWVVEQLNDGYYGWKDGSLRELRFSDGSLGRIDPWQNAGTVAIQYLFSQWYPPGEFEKAVGPSGFAATYRALFGDPFALAVDHIPGNLRQPDFRLPFPDDRQWSYSGGPHPGWGDSLPWASIDLAPPAIGIGCTYSVEPVLAMADGVIARVGWGLVMLDLDGDGDERTGWVIMYLHDRTDSIPDLGQHLKKGDFIGNPSCEGGGSTGTHIHLSRKFNGEWMPADSAVPFDIAGWVPQKGDIPYAGTMTHDIPALYAIAYPGITPTNRVFNALP